jgi:hypothetical protein
VAADQPSPHSGLGRALDEARSAGLSVEQAFSEIEALSRLTRTRARLAAQRAVDRETGSDKAQVDRTTRAFIALTALLRTQSDALTKVVSRIRAGNVAAEKLLDALSAARTERAQRALVELATDKKLPAKTRVRAMTSSIRTERPSPATIDALIALSDDPLLSTHGIYGLGTAARRLRLAGATADSVRAGCREPRSGGWGDFRRLPGG